MAALYQLGQRYLDRQYPIDNGGVVAFILNNLEFENGDFITNKIENVNLWISYFKDVTFNITRPKPVRQNQTYDFNDVKAVKNPVRLVSILIICWLTTFLILIGLLYITMEMQHRKDKKDKKKIKDFRFVLPGTRRRKNCREKLKRCMVIFSALTVIVLWIIFMAILCTSQYIISSKINKGNTNKTNRSPDDSISYAVSICFKYLNNFFDIITNKTEILIGNSMTNLSLDIRNQLNTSVVELGNQILITLKITEIFELAKILLTSFDHVIHSMTFISDNCHDILVNINSVKGTVAVFQKDLDAHLGKICKALNNSHELLNGCKALRARNQYFVNRINTNLVDPSSSTIALFILKEYNINITDITRIFNKIDKEFHANLKALFNASIEQINIASYLNTVKNVWTQFVRRLMPSIINVNSYNAVFRSTLDNVFEYENLVVIILIFLIFIAVLLVMLLSFRDTLQDRSLNKYTNFGIQLTFIIVLIISALFCIIILIFSNFSQSEICNQINTTRGINVLDQMINNKLTIPWNTTIKPIISSYSKINISVIQPMNIVSGIKDKCKNNGVGILYVMGIGNIVNVTELVRSQSIMSIISKAENNSLQAFLDVHLEQIVPADLTNFLAKTKTVIDYFERIDYNTSIQELQKPLVDLVDFSQYFNDLSMFAMKSSVVIGWSTDLISVNNTANQLLNSVSNWTYIQNNVTKLSLSFQTLQSHRNISVITDKLKSIIIYSNTLFINHEKIIFIFSSLFNNIITINFLNTFERLVKGSYSSLAYSMMPCGDLSLIFETITTTVCSNSNFNVSLAAFGLILLAETIICQIVSILVMISTSLRLYYEPNVSKC